METQPDLDQTPQPADDGSARPFYRRRLPHWQPAGGTIFLTWRLYGSLPEEALQRLANEQQLLQKRPERPGELPRDRALRHDRRLFALVDQMLALADTGPHWLQDERIAQLAVDALFHHHLKLYVLLAFVVMPNHMHVLLQPLPIEERQARKPAPQYVALRKITQSLKGYTAEANRILKRTGLPFWQDESYDHWARDEAEMQRIMDDIESDPVRAALGNHPQDRRCSSAWERELGRMVTTSA